jgi:hypothetical protein
MSKVVPADKGSKFSSGRVAFAGALTGLLCASTALWPALGADTAKGGTAIPPLMLPPTSGWAGGFTGPLPPPNSYLPDDYLNSPTNRERALSLGAPPDKVVAFLAARSLNEYIPPASGIGPISDGPEHPFYNNPMRAVVGKNGTYRVADLSSEAAKNLMPWAIEALKKQNALTIVGKNGETRQARCWELGVPDIHEAPQPLYFIQTPKEVVMYQGHRARHIYLNVPHTKNPTPSWYGESVGHYEGDTLVVDTIGQNDKTFVDGYRTPHTTQLHVIERYKVVKNGNGLDVSFTVEDPGTFYKPWSARRPRYRVKDRPLNEEDTICAAGNDDRFNLGFDPVPHADVPDF